MYIWRFGSFPRWKQPPFTLPLAPQDVAFYSVAAGAESVHKPSSHKASSHIKRHGVLCLTYRWSFAGLCGFVHCRETIFLGDQSFKHEDRYIYINILGCNLHASQLWFRMCSVYWGVIDCHTVLLAHGNGDGIRHELSGASFCKVELPLKDFSLTVTFGGVIGWSFSNREAYHSPGRGVR